MPRNSTFALATTQGQAVYDLRQSDDDDADIRSIRLRLFFPNGDFIHEDVVIAWTPVLPYIHDLENGYREVSLELPEPESMSEKMMRYELVWGGTTLCKTCTFGTFFDAQSIIFPQPSTLR